MPTITPAGLASELAASTPALSADKQRLFLILYRLLAAGQPVAVTELADSAGQPLDAVSDAVERLPGVFTDE
jgi:hypothetical protein